jgi:hypothetical protein
VKGEVSGRGVGGGGGGARWGTAGVGWGWGWGGGGGINFVFEFGQGSGNELCYKPVAPSGPQGPAEHSSSRFCTTKFVARPSVAADTRRAVSKRSTTFVC